jgi:hypothetical protein
MTWLPQYLVDVHGLPVSAVFAGYLVPVALVLVMNLVAGALLRAGWPPGPLLAAAVASQALVWWLLPWTGADWRGWLSLVVYGLGAGVVPTCLFAMPSAILGRARGTARAFGVVMTGRNLGVLVGPILIAQTFNLTGAWALAAPLFGALTTLCVGLAVLLARWLRRPAAR